MPADKFQVLSSNNFYRIINKAKKFLPFSAIFAVVFAVFYRFEFNSRMPNFSGEDSFYHVGMAKYILEHGIPHQFPYLFYTILNKNFVDHQLLFHLILIPFIKIFGDFTGPKLMTILFVALSFAFLYLIFRERKLKFSLIYALTAFFIMPADFYFRMAFIRVQAAALFFMVLAVYLIFKKKMWPLLILSFLFVWLYGGFVFMPVLAVIYLISNVLTGEKFDIKIPTAILTGTILGLIINPFFPHNIGFLIVQIFGTGLGAKPYSGGEWQPYDTWFWFTSSLVPIMIFFGGLLVCLINKKKIDYKVLTIVLFSFVLLALELKSKRYVEYWPFWAVTAGIIMAGPYLEEKIVNLKPKYFKKNPIVMLNLFQHPVAHDRIPKQVRDDTLRRHLKSDLLLPFLLCVLIFISFWYSSGQMSKGMNDTHAFINLDAARDMQEVLKTDSNEGDIVFTDDWDVFPYYFYLNRKDYYIVGLDPEFMNKFDHTLYEEFSAISSGRDSYNLGRIKTDFNAKWVIVASDHPQFKTNLKNNSKLFEQIYSNQEFTLFKVL